MRLHDFFEAKKMSAKDDPCWDGYHMVGNKQKDGREVPNCVPGKKGVSEGQTPELELERLKLRQNAWKKAPLRDQAATQARIRELEKQIKDKKGVSEGFKNTYEVNDRVETPMGPGTIVAVSPNINVDGKIRVKLDDPSRAGEDGKLKDTFTLTTMQVKHITETKELDEISKKTLGSYVQQASKEVGTSGYRIGFQHGKEVGQGKWGPHRAKDVETDAGEEEKYERNQRRKRLAGLEIAGRKIAKDFSESDMSGIMHAARNYNKSFIVTAKTAEGATKKYRVKAQSERVAREKFSKHFSMAKIVDVKEEE